MEKNKTVGTEWKTHTPSSTTIHKTNFCGFNIAIIISDVILLLSEFLLLTIHSTVMVLMSYASRVIWQVSALTSGSAQYWQWSLILVDFTLIMTVSPCNKMAPANLFDFLCSTNLTITWNNRDTITIVSFVCRVTPDNYYDDWRSQTMHHGETAP
jgi:hypothetical protein